MRYLLEEVTGVSTGSSRCDLFPKHLPKLQPWGGYLCEGGYEGNRKEPTLQDIVVIKSHFPADLKKGDVAPQGKILRIVRHPIDSIYSLYALECKKKSVEVILPIPDAFISWSTEAWKRHESYWKNRKTFTFRYEDLMEFPMHYLQQSTDFYEIKATKEDIERAVLRYPPNGNASLQHLSKFTKGQLEYIKEKLSILMKEFNYEIP